MYNSMKYSEGERKDVEAVEMNAFCFPEGGNQQEGWMALISLFPAHCGNETIKQLINSASHCFGERVGFGQNFVLIKDLEVQDGSLFMTRANTASSRSQSIPRSHIACRFTNTKLHSKPPNKDYISTNHKIGTNRVSCPCETPGHLVYD